MNNLHIQSHDAELDANTSSEMVTTDVKEPGVPEHMEPSTSTAVSCMDTSSVNSSADPVFDQSTQSTSTSHLEVALKRLLNKATQVLMLYYVSSSFSPTFNVFCRIRLLQRNKKNISSSFSSVIRR